MLSCDGSSVGRRQDVYPRCQSAQIQAQRTLDAHRSHAAPTTARSQQPSSADAADLDEFTVSFWRCDVNGQTVGLAVTQSTGTSSGALVISGGVGIAKDVYVGGKLYVEGQSIDLNGTEISSDGTSVTFPNVTLGANGVITFADGTVQKTKAPQMYTNADAAAGLSIDDLLPGDFYYDDVTESIFIMVDTGLGYNNLLDLTVRAA